MNSNRTTKWNPVTQYPDLRGGRYLVCNAALKKVGTAYFYNMGWEGYACNGELFGRTIGISITHWAHIPELPEAESRQPSHRYATPEIIHTGGVYGPYMKDDDFSDKCR